MWRDQWGLSRILTLSGFFCCCCWSYYLRCKLKRYEDQILDKTWNISLIVLYVSIILSIAFIFPQASNLVSRCHRIFSNVSFCLMMVKIVGVLYRHGRTLPGYYIVSLSFNWEKKKHVSTERMTCCHLCHSQLESVSTRSCKALIVIVKKNERVHHGMFFFSVYSTR